MVREELQPTPAEEIMADYGAETKLVTIGAKGPKPKVFRIKKFDPTAQAVIEVMSLPDFRGREVDTKAITSRAGELLSDPGRKGDLVKAAILGCTLEPQVVDGPARQGCVSFNAMPPMDRLELLGEIFRFSGFTTDTEKFFREAAGEGGARPGSDSEPLQEAPVGTAGDAGGQAGG